MHLPDKMKSRPVVFVSAFAIIYFGCVSVILALQRFVVLHRLDDGLLLGIVFIIWGAWAVLTFKGNGKSP
jgi:hypothetical protein